MATLPHMYRSRLVYMDPTLLVIKPAAVLRCMNTSVVSSKAFLRLLYAGILEAQQIRQGLCRLLDSKSHTNPCVAVLLDIPSL